MPDTYTLEDLIAPQKESYTLDELVSGAETVSPTFDAASTGQDTVEGEPVKEFTPMTPGEVASVPLKLAGKAILGAANIPTDIANYVRGSQPGMPNYVEPLTPESSTPQIPNIPESAVDNKFLKYLSLATPPYGLPISARAGVANALIKTLQGTLPPFAPPDVGLSLPLAGVGGIAGRVAAGAFAAPMLASIPEQVSSAIDTAKSKDSTSMETAEAFSQPLISGLLGTLAAAHASGLTSSAEAAAKTITEDIKNAIQKQSANESVLRGERPEVGLPQVGEGDTKSETPATTQEGKATSAEGQPGVLLSEPSPEGQATPVDTGTAGKTEFTKEELLEPLPEKETTTQGEVVGMGGAVKGEFSNDPGNPDIYGIAERVREQRSKSGIVDPVKPGEGISAEDSVEKGREILAKDPTAGEKAVALFESDPQKRISAEGIAAARAHGERLQFKARRIEEQFGTKSPEYKAAYKELSKFDKRIKPMQTEWHRAGQAQQGETDIDTGSFTAMQREFTKKTGREFNPKQGKRAERITDNTKKAEKEVILANEKLAESVNKTVPLSEAERQAQEAVWKQHRDAAVRLAGAENKSRLADIERDKATAKVQEAAAARAKAAADKTVRGNAKRLADSENARRLKEAEAAKALADVKAKRAADELKRANKAKTKAAIEAVKAENKERVLKADTPSYVWTKAQEYIKSGMENLNDIVWKVGADTGLSNNQVLDALGKDKRKKYLANDVWRKQQRLRLLDQSAKRWLRDQQLGGIQSGFEWAAGKMFNLKIGAGFHGFVALGTHAPMVFFRPNKLKTYFSNYARMAKMIKNTAFYEAQIQDLMRRPTYRMWKESGLGNDPYMYEDFSTKDGGSKWQRFLGAGNRGYSVLKFLRQDLADSQWEKLPKTSRTPEMAESIAKYVNHETGWSQKSGFKGAHLGLFAPRLLMAKTGYVFGDPLKTVGVAAKIVYNWKDPKIVSEADRHFAAHVFKEKATVLATMASMLAINQAILSSLNSDQKINGIPESLGGSGIDPMRSDFLKFKGAGKTVSYGNSFVALARFPLRIGATIASKHGLNKIVYADERVDKIVGDFARTQLSPIAGTGADLMLGRDFQERPLPRAGFGLVEGDTAMPKRLRAQGVQPYTWTEYMTVTALPIPLAEAMHDVWRDGYGLDSEGVSWMEKLWAIIQTLPKDAAMAFTGARISEDFEVKK